jgi:hypothetical protein
MRIFYLLLLLVMLANLSWAQKFGPNQYTFALNEKSITPAADFRDVRKVLKSARLANPLSQANHFILQFTSIPTLEEQQQLQSHGITLLNYVQGNAYFVSVTSGFFNIDKSASMNLRSLIDILPEYKMNTELASGNIPDYAMEGENMVKVVVSFFNDIDDAIVTDDISKLKTSHFKMMRIFNQFTASIKRSDIYILASMDWVQNIEMAPPPAVFKNDHGRSLHRTNVLNSTIPGLGFGLTGKGVKIGLWDADVEYHRDFNDRVFNRESEMHFSSHGTHTCGTLISAGLLDPKAIGMAPEATVYSWNFNRQSNGLTVAEERHLSLDNDGIEITSNSWGPSLNTCPSKLVYDSYDHNDDQLAFLYPYFLYAFAAGNEQSVCDSIGGYYTISTSLKNSLICAAIDQMENMSDFSSFGPSRDGRLIPNISGDGVSVYSNLFNNRYGLMSGTSMATPGIAGTLALVFQRYKETHGGAQPISALMRGLACNTSHDLGNPGPDFKYGYGEINGLRAIEAMEQNNYFINKVSHGTNYSQNITVPAGAVALKIMLSWTDPAGTVGSSRVLINNLDLSVTHDGVKTLPWILDPADPSANAVRGIDKLNNLEQVSLPNPAAGSYQINVAGYQVPEGVQEFAVVYDIVMPDLRLTYPIGGEFLAPESQVVVRWDCEGYNNPFTLEYSTDGGVNYSVVASNIDSSSKSYLWTIPTGTTSAGKLRISNGLRLNVDKGSFHVMPVPQNVKVPSVQCGVAGPYTIQWDAVANARYEILKLDGLLYKHLADATSTNYNIVGIVPDKDNLYCIRAIDLTTGAISQRSLAVTLEAAAPVASLPYREKFDSQSSANFCFTADKGLANVRYINITQQYGIRLEGTSGATTDWVASTDTTCFAKNPTYVVKASIGNIDASQMAGKHFRLKFDYRQKYRTSAGTSYFRVKVNGNYLTSMEGTQIYGTTNQSSYKSVYYDLSAYAGLPSLSIDFEAVCKTGYTTNKTSDGTDDFSDDTKDKGDFVAIDNIEIVEVAEDMAMTSLSVSGGMTNAETISVKIKNLSGSRVVNIPVSYSINGGIMVSESVPGPIEQMAEVTYLFTTKADFSKAGFYTVSASVKRPNDPVPENNTQTITKVNNGTDIIMGITSGTVTTCSAVLVDPGGRYVNYKDSLDCDITLNPGSPDKNIKITFTEFETEQESDFLYVYSGTSPIAANLLGKFSGSILPPSFTSLALGGELYLRFTSDNGLNYKGFIATIECVDKTIDAALTEITAPANSGVKTVAETVTVTVSNPGIHDLAKADVYYQVDNNTPVHEQVDTIVSRAPAKSYSFKTKADLSVPGTYSLKAWIVVPGDAFDANNSATAKIISTSKKNSIKDIGVEEILTIYPKRLAGANSFITASVKNYGDETFTGSIAMAYTIDGGPQVVENYPVTMNADETISYTFTNNADLSRPDHTYHIDVSAKVAGDANPANDHSTYTVVTPAGSVLNVIGTFNGTTALVTVPALAAVDLMKNYTVECWVNLSDPLGFGRIFDKTNVILFYQTTVGSIVYPTDSYILSVTTEDNSNLTYYYPGAVKIHQWQHLALTVDATGTRYTFYINGVAQTPELLSGIPTAAKTNSTADIYLGNRLDLARGTAGSIDEVRIWNSCLSQAAIASNMMTNYPAGMAGMLAYYKFKEGNGNYLYDYSANDNTANIYGADVTGFGKGKFWNNQTPLMHSYAFAGEVIPTTYDEATKTFTSIVPAGANLSNLTANFTADQNSTVTVGNTPQVSGKTVNNFSGTVDYTVAGIGFNTGITQTFHANVTLDTNSDCDLTAFTFETANNPGLSGQIALAKNGSNFYKKVTPGTVLSALKATYTSSQGSSVFINGIQQTSPQLTALDYTHPLMAKVVSENGRSFRNYSLIVDSRNSEANLIAFNISGNQVAASNIVAANHSIGIWVNKKADLSMLTPTFSVSANAHVYVNNVTQWNGITSNNFSRPLVYQVVSEDESTTVDWNVTVKIDYTKPVIKLAGDTPMKVAYGAVFADPGATALDNVDGDLTSKIVVTGSVYTNIIGTYRLTYKVSDAAGNPADEVSRIVNVVKAAATIEISELTQYFNENRLGVTVATVPAGLPVIVTYNGSATVPMAIGKYAVVATINDINYEGKSSSTFEILPGIKDGVRIYSDGNLIYVIIEKIKTGAHLSVLDINGRTLYETSALSEGRNMIIQNLSSGSYIVRLQVDDKRYLIKIILTKNRESKSQ